MLLYTHIIISFAQHNLSSFLLKYRKCVQVSLPHYADPEFHTDSLRRYKVFICDCDDIVDCHFCHWKGKIMIEMMMVLVHINQLSSVLREPIVWILCAIPSRFTFQERLITFLLLLQMYLYLKKKNPKTFLVPCYDMDLIWHSHQVFESRFNLINGVGCCWF